MARTALIVAAALLTLAVGASLAAAQAPAGDSVTGSGTARFINGGLEGLTSRSRSTCTAGPIGEKPRGRSRCCCASATRRASSSGRRRSEEPPTATVDLLNTVTGLRVVVQLGAAPGGQFIALSGADGPDDCALGSSPTVAQVIDGQFSIGDAPPLPNSRDQCKNGGWRSYGDTFANQGQCVAFVERRPKPDGPGRIRTCV